MALRLHNTLTGKKEVFRPNDPKRVTLYVCGPTVYDYAHIGNARPMVVFDVLYRLLRHLYGVKHVRYARNITDIDDKIMKAAAETGQPIRAVAEKFAKVYRADAAALGALKPTLEPKATASIAAMKGMIAKLLKSKHAYVADGHVLFHVRSMKGYGKLSKKSREDLIAGARVEVAPYKRDPADFVLWKPSTPTQPGWPSPWGRGRPGWHLECSAMVEKHLGKTIDIHGGGLDLVFPHHENEIAQSQCVHKGAPLARFWLHNGYLTLKGEKMSKSVGNIVTIHELVEKFKPKEEALRLALLSAHYRQPLDFSEELVKEQRRLLDTWYRITKKPDIVTAIRDQALGMLQSPSDIVKTGKKRKIPPQIIEALEDDLNTPVAIAELERLSRSPETAPDLLAGANFLGLLKKSYDEWFGRVESSTAKGEIKFSGHAVGAAHHTPEAIERLIQERRRAREDKDFEKADQIRKQLETDRILLEDKPDGSTIWRRKD